MTNAQSIIETLLSGYVEQYALSDAAQSVVDSVRHRLGSSPDARKDIEMLYGAKDCEDIALGLLWLADRAGQDPDRAEPTPDEEQVVHTGITLTLTRMGLLGEAGGEEDTMGETVTEEAETPVAFQEEPDAVSIDPTLASVSEDGGLPAWEEPEPTVEDDLLAAADEPIAEAAEESFSPEPSSSPVAAEGTSDQAEIGRLLEQLLEALQAGEDTRAEFLTSLRASFALCLSQETQDASFRSYCEAVDDFLGYVQENDLLDDVRVMNFFTNVQEPYAHWMEAAEGERDGILEQAISFLSDFRAMFE